MIRKAFRMSVHHGHEDEYARRHNPIWQELADALVSHGVSNYSIFLDPQTGDLRADSPGPMPDDSDGARFIWSE